MLCLVRLPFSSAIPEVLLAFLCFLVVFVYGCVHSIFMHIPLSSLPILFSYRHVSAPQLHTQNPKSFHYLLSATVSGSGTKYTAYALSCSNKYTHGILPLTHLSSAHAPKPPSANFCSLIDRRLRVSIKFSAICAPIQNGRSMNVDAFLMTRAKTLDFRGLEWMSAMKQRVSSACTERGSMSMLT
jgi:hypothetical protein